MFSSKYFKKSHLNAYYFLSIIIILVLCVTVLSGFNFISKNKTDKPFCDTLRIGNYNLFLVKADSFPLFDIYGDLEYRNRLTESILNSHEKAKIIQNYLAPKYKKYFYSNSNSLVLKLSNGKKLSFPHWDEENEEGFNFEHYFPCIDYYLLKVQWTEGGCWMLINRKNGFRKYISGLPYVSPSKKYIVTINDDIDAAYSFNGIELHKVLNDSLKTEFQMETNFAPENLRWVSDSIFLLKRYYYSELISFKYTTDYIKVKIQKK